MTNYQLAKLIQMAGGIPSRKRVQKTVHLLQCAGCDFGLDFRIHYYGPYCSVLAEQLDCLTGKGVLVETQEPAGAGTQYNYELNQNLCDSLREHEETSQGREARDKIELFGGLVSKLGETKPRVLELASTMVAFFQRSHDWDAAQSQVAEFKAEGEDSPMMREARALAEDVVGYKDAKHR